MRLTTISAAALATAIAMQPAAIWASDDKSETRTITRAAGVSPQVDKDIRALLTDQGYQVRKIKVDDGLYEAYALKGDQRFEIYLDADLKIVKLKTDD